jgi:uncharacterized protein YuzE
VKLGSILPIEFTVKYDKVGDTLYIKFRDDRIVESDEVTPGVIVDYNEKGEVVGIEVLEFSRRRIDLSKLVLEGPEVLVVKA